MSEFKERYIVKAVFDTATTDSAGVSNKTAAAHGLGVYIPKNAIVTNTFYDVITTFTSATDAATIALKVQAANDIVSAIAISDSSNPWDSGLHGGLKGSPVLGSNATTMTKGTAILYASVLAASMVKATATRELTATVANEVLTAGKLNLFVEYYMSELT